MYEHLIQELHNIDEEICGEVAGIIEEGDDPEPSDLVTCLNMIVDGLETGVYVYMRQASALREGIRLLATLPPMKEM